MHLAWKKTTLVVSLPWSHSHPPKFLMVPVNVFTAMLYSFVDHQCKCRIQRPPRYFLWALTHTPRGAAPTAKCLFCNHNDTTNQTCHEFSICYIYKASLWPNSNSCWRTAAPQNLWASVLCSFPVSRGILKVHTKRPIFSGYLSAPGCWDFCKYVWILNVGPSVRLPKDCRMHHFLKENKSICINLVPVWRLINIFLICFLAFDIMKISYVSNGLQKARLCLAKAGIYPPLSCVIFLFFKASYVYFLPSLPHFFHF